MKITLFTSFLILSLLLTFGNSHAVDLQKEDKAETVQQKNLSPKIYTTLGFKGIHLGMSRKEILDIGWDSERKDWQLTSGVGLDKSEYIFFTTDTPIGCVGEGESELCYKIELVSVRFFNGKVIEIILQGPSLVASRIDDDVKDWAKFAYKALSKKHGKPTKTLIDLNKFNVFSVKSGYSRLVYEWKIQKERLLVTIGESNFKYYSAIEMSDASAKDAIEKNRKEKVRTEL
ncbi:MAG: hypothetical protein FD174_4260 [Geobacteraceae bacterium]|nr:MAG: hypothetical protein FD174_4260 [Geobacteraceae bacterium]